MFDDSTIVGIRVLLNGERVDVADLGFICDGDELLLVRESDLLMEASITSNNDELQLNETSSLTSDVERLGIESNGASSPNTTNNLEASQFKGTDWVTLNVGGTKFVTCRSTIETKVTELIAITRIYVATYIIL